MTEPPVPRGSSITSDHQEVERLLGRPPKGPYEVVVRHADGSPRVIRNGPFLDDGTPMPTRYWLVSQPDRVAVGRLEAGGGVRAAEAAVPADEIAAAHSRYAAERDAAIDLGHVGPRPSGGVGGTRRGVKCLHAHYAWHLAGGDDPVGEWTASRLEKAAPAAATPVVAAVDCGTNSTRVLISRGGIETLDRRMTITRLGEGVDANGRLAPAAIERVLTCLREYRTLMDRHGVTEVRVAATSAARDAANRDEFFDAVEEAIGVRPELLGGHEEGRLSFLGATAELDPADGPFLVVDIGGGSTEFVYGTTEAEAVVSIDVGCVRMTEQFFHHDPARAEELSSCLSVIELHLDDVAREIPQLRDARRLVGLAGTVSTTAAVELGLTGYDRDRIHHFVLSKHAVEDVFRTLATENAAERAENPGMEPGRVDVIVGGLCVLVKIMRHFGFGECLVSESDILDGLVASLVGERTPGSGL